MGRAVRCRSVHHRTLRPCKLLTRVLAVASTAGALGAGARGGLGGGLGRSLLGRGGLGGGLGSRLGHRLGGGALALEQLQQGEREEGVSLAGTAAAATGLMAGLIRFVLAPLWTRGPPTRRKHCGRGVGPQTRLGALGAEQRDGLHGASGSPDAKTKLKDRGTAVRAWGGS